MQISNTVKTSSYVPFSIYHVRLTYLCRPTHVQSNVDYTLEESTADPSNPEKMTLMV